MQRRKFYRPSQHTELGSALRRYPRPTGNGSAAVPGGSDRVRKSRQPLLRRPDLDQDSYVISGDRGTAQGFLVEAIAGIAGNSSTAGAVTSAISDSGLHYAPNGDFSFTLSAQKPAQGDWMPLLPGTDNLLVRFTFQNWLTERPGSISIKRIGGPIRRVLIFRPRAPPLCSTTQQTRSSTKHRSTSPKATDSAWPVQFPVPSFPADRQ